MEKEHKKRKKEGHKEKEAVGMGMIHAELQLLF